LVLLLQRKPQNSPVQHLGQAEELAQAVLSLMSNTYIAGAILPVDGGLTSSPVTTS